ncbi:MAG: MFS transporter [Chloroflexi bacterium]|nr:MFS transporter [Chloroflexota bacterium]
MTSSTAEASPRFFYGWLVVAAAFFATFGSVTFFNPVLGVFSQLLEEEFGWKRADVAGALTLAGILAGLGAPFAGIATDRWGGRWVIVGSAVVMAVCALTLSQMSALWHLLVFFAIGRAVSVGAMSPAGFVATSNWFIRRRPFVAGIVAVGPRIGMATFPLVVALVIQVFGTWRAGWVALAVIVILTALPALVFMRRRPEDMGLLPDGDAQPVDLAPGAPAVSAEIDFTLREALRTRAYWFVGVAVGLVVFCGGAINFHQIPHLIDQGLPRTQAALIVTVFSGFGALGAVVGGMLAQRFTMRWTMVVALAGMSGSILLLLVATSFTSALMYAVAYGSFFGVVVSFMQVVHADYFGRRSMGTIHGSIQPFQMGMNAAGPFLVGLWYDQTGSYSAAFVAFSIIFAAAAVGMALASYPQPPLRAATGDEVSSDPNRAH